MAGKKIKPCITSTVRQIVANALNIPVSDVNNDTKLNYWAAMDAIYDLHKKYPVVCFPEENFDKYCRLGTLRNYVARHMKRTK